MQNWVCTNWAPAATLPRETFGCQSGRRIDRHVGGAEEERRLAGNLAPGRQLAVVAQPPRGLEQRFRIDVEHRLGIGLVAGFRVVAGEHQDVADAERGGAHQFALQRDAVLVAAGDLQDRLDAGAEKDRRGRERAHVGAGAGAVGDIDRIGEPAQRRRLAQQVLRVAGDRRGDLRGHDKAARPQPLGEGAGEGGASIAHGKARLRGASGDERLYALRADRNWAFRARFLDRKHLSR